MIRSYRHNYKKWSLRKEAPPRLYDMTNSPFFYQTTTIAPFVKHSLQGSWQSYGKSFSFRDFSHEHGYRNQFRLGFIIWEISALFPRRKKGRKFSGRVLAPNSRNKPNMAKHKVITFAPIIALVTLIAVLLQLKTMPFRLPNSSRFRAGNRAEVFIWPNFRPSYGDPGWKNRNLGNRVSPPAHVNTWKILQRI